VPTVHLPDTTVVHHYFEALERFSSVRVVSVVGGEIATVRFEP
jgi:hypothetical protein